MDEWVRLKRWMVGGYQNVVGLIRPRLGEAELREIESWNPLLRAMGEGDADWDWKGLVEEARRRHGESMEAAALMLEGRVQGAILFWPSENASRIDDVPLIYVDRLAVAPLNRSRSGGPGRVSPCGRVLMTFARRRSHRLGHEGRVGLHSLPESEGFYAKLGMRRLDPVMGDERFSYFEWEREKLP